MHRKGCFTKLGASSTISVGSGRLLVTKGELNKKKNDPVVPKASILCLHTYIFYIFICEVLFLSVLSYHCMVCFVLPSSLLIVQTLEYFKYSSSVHLWIDTLQLVFRKSPPPRPGYLLRVPLPLLTSTTFLPCAFDQINISTIIYVRQEEWVQCDSCERWVHQICGLFNVHRSSSHFCCPKCILKNRQPK